MTSATVAGQRGTPVGGPSAGRSSDGSGEPTDDIRPTVSRVRVTARVAPAPWRPLGPGYHRAMDFGLCLPNFRDGSSAEGLDAAAEVAERLGWSTVWTTDHVIVAHATEAEYGRVYEAILTLAWLAGRHPRVRLGTSVIVVPQRNAVLLAKELSTLDSLSGGRVTAGIGVGWNTAEFGNLAMSDRFHVRGAYLDETIRLWRHLWSGATEPFHGRFHTLEDFTFGPRPVQDVLPILIGGTAEPALRRAGRLADGYHASSTSPGPSRRDDPDRDGRGDGGRPARAVRSRRGLVSGSPERPTTPTLCAARPTRWRPRCGRTRRSAWTTWRCRSRPSTRPGSSPRRNGSSARSCRSSDHPSGGCRARPDLGYRWTRRRPPEPHPRRGDRMGDKTPKRPPKPKKPKKPATP